MHTQEISLALSQHCGITAAVSPGVEIYMGQIWAEDPSVCQAWNFLINSLLTHDSTNQWQLSQRNETICENLTSSIHCMASEHTGHLYCMLRSCCVMHLNYMYYNLLHSIPELCSVWLFSTLTLSQMGLAPAFMFTFFRCPSCTLLLWLEVWHFNSV